MGECSYVEAELKYQSSHDSLVNGTFADFPDYEGRTGGEWRDAKRKCAVEKEVVSPRRHGGKFEWPEARRRYRSLFPRDILALGGEG